MASDASLRLRLPRQLRIRYAALVTCLVGAALTACGQTARAHSTCDGELSGSAPTYVTAWFHDGGTVSAEAKTLREQVDAFNASQRDVRVKLLTLPVGDYAQQVTEAAAHSGLPDILDFDGPNLYNYAWSGKLKPLLVRVTGPAPGPPALDRPAGHVRGAAVACRPSETYVMSGTPFAGVSGHRSFRPFVGSAQWPTPAWCSALAVSTRAR